MHDSDKFTELMELIVEQLRRTRTIAAIALGMSIGNILILIFIK